MDYLYGSEGAERQTVYISEEALDKIVLDLVRSEMKRLGTVKHMLSRIENKRNEYLKDYQRKIKNHQSILVSLQAERSDLYLNYRIGGMERVDYLSQKAIISSKIETLSQEIAHYEALKRQIEEKHNEQVSWIKHLAKCQKQTVLTEELLNVLIERIDVDVDKSVTVTFACQIGGDGCD